MVCKEYDNHDIVKQATTLQTFCSHGTDSPFFAQSFTDILPILQRRIVVMTVSAPQCECVKNFVNIYFWQKRLPIKLWLRLL